MSTDEPRDYGSGARPVDSPIVDEAVASIRAFALPGHEDEISREQAQGVLRWWQRHDELSTDEITAILHRFPPTDAGWISGSMSTDEATP